MGLDHDAIAEAAQLAQELTDLRQHIRLLLHPGRSPRGHPKTPLSSGEARELARLDQTLVGLERALSRWRTRQELLRDPLENAELQ
jgi:hypothetical protein